MLHPALEKLVYRRRRDAADAENGGEDGAALDTVMAIVGKYVTE